MLVSVQQSVQTPDDQSMVYFRDVLGLETSEAEDELDASLRSEAQELGLCLDESKPITRSSGKTASMDTTLSERDFLDNFAKWEDGASRNASVATEALDSDSLTSVSPERDHSPPRETETMAPTVPAWTFFDTVPELLALQAACEAQCQRFKLWTSQNRAAMEAKHIGAVAALHRSQETALEALLDTHALALADAEDKQVTAESTLREVHDQAYRVNVTALKQQEAYCAGTYSDGQPHGRTITALDRTELDKTRRTRDNMASRQESAINVLRGEQGRRIRARVQRQDKEAADLEVLQEREIDALGRHNVAELEELGTIEKEKKTRLATRWRMQTMILMRRAGIEEEDVEACQGIVVDWDGALNRPPVPEKDARRGATRPRYDSMLADGPAQV
ncbi:hypothetical protein B0A48_13059 [Cryoendolithus antarcticus]|uniref:Uncharacterized protein n=1 Tax=Cryoendolithus antarcticus TaxID=1507870 RepID=A0A1V8SN71_9PEZI|nr:hypothetical protein B0A48_13059 [Cryoendolithus antarcticus]